MRVVLAIFAAACGNEPVLVGKLCSADRPCPTGLFCSKDGVCEAELEDTETLSLITEGPGAGIVTSAPAGLRCDASCDVDFPTGLEVTLTAHSVAGSGFAGWKGACTGTGPCVLSMSDARTVTAVFGVEVAYPWAVQYGGTADDRVVSVDVDFAGNPIAAGTFGSTVMFGSQAETSRGGSDGWIAQLDPSARIAWLSTFGGSNDDAPLSVASSIDSKVIAGGWYGGPADLFGEMHPGIGGADPLFARLDDDGALESALDLGSNATDTSQGVVFDDEGGAWIAGWTDGPLMAGGLTRGHVGGADAYLVHFDREGAAKFVEVFGGAGNDRAHAVDRNPAGDRVAIFGVFQGSIAFGGMPVTSTAAYGLFVAVFDAAGEHLWSRGFAAGSAGEPFADGCFDRDGSLILAGGFHDAIDFGDRERRSMGDLDAFAAKLSADGDLSWAHTFGGPSADAFFAMRVDPLGHTILGGGFNEMAAFGGEELTSAGGWDAAIVKLDPAGAHV